MGLRASRRTAELMNSIIGIPRLAQAILACWWASFRMVTAVSCLEPARLLISFRFLLMASWGRDGMRSTTVYNTAQQKSAQHNNAQQ